MKIFLIGGNALTQDSPDFASHHARMLRSAANIAQAVCENGNDLVVCSPFPDSADASAVVRAAEVLRESGTGASIDFHIPRCPSVESKVRELVEKQSVKNFRQFVHPSTVDKSGGKPTNYDWLLSQLLAMESSHVVVALGGKTNGSASMLLRLAEGLRKPVLPFTFLGGAADESYQRRQYHLQDLLGEDVGLLREHDRESEMISLLPQVASQNFGVNSTQGAATFFISYARARPEEADFVETVLRRRGLVVYRDERDFGAGSALQGEIEEYIHRTSVFIALWCKEYACSPWCFDELELALALNKSKGLKIWLLCLDDTRIVPRGARDLVGVPSKSRLELEGNVLALLEKAANCS